MQVPDRKVLFVFGVIALSIIFIGSVLGPLISPFTSGEPVSSLENRLSEPSLRHWFGTDQYGRDVFTRVLAGGRLSLSIGLSVVALSLVVGGLYGLVAAYAGGFCDRLLMRFVDVLLAFPLMYLAVTCMALFGTGMLYVVIILACTSWMDIARLVRAEVLSLKQQPFVLRAKASGLTDILLMVRYLLPNTLATVSTVAILRVADVILIESSLSFLGLGVQPPHASWGSIISDGRMVLSSAWWISFFPGLAIVLTILSLNCIGTAFNTRFLHSV